MNLKIALACLAVLAGGYLLVNGGAYTSGPVRKKIEIEVATPHGMAHGSSVIEVRHSRAPWWFPTGTGNRNSVGFWGEAPYVDLGDGRYLFVAVNNPRNATPIYEHFTRSALRPDGHFAPDRTPLLVTFGDIDDVKTAREVRPEALDAAFGPGFQLVSLTAIPTHDRPTKGTLATKFPSLFQGLNIPPLQRSPERYRTFPRVADPADDGLWTINSWAFEGQG